MKIVISGYGFVGKSTYILLRTYLNEEVELSINDPLVKSEPNWVDAEYHFISVPSNLIEDKQKLDISIVKAAIAKADANGFNGRHVIRSTISPLDYDEIVDTLKEEPISWPEFIREAHWEEDAFNPKLSVMAGKYAHALIDKLDLPIRFVPDPRAAWMMKLARNAFYANKVIIANELMHASKQLGIDYDSVKHALLADPNIGPSHWAQPGQDGLMGYGGKCLPKDTAALANVLKSLGNSSNFADWTTRKNKEIR